MPVRKKRRDSLLKNLGFSTQLLKIFEREGYRTVGDVLLLSASEFLELPRAKKKHLKRLQEMFSRFSYTEKDTGILTPIESKKAREKPEKETVTIVVYDQNIRFPRSHDP